MSWEAGGETFSPNHPWWTRADHDALAAVIRRARPRTVLEFGSGVSTLTFLVEGVAWIDTFDDHPGWYDFHAPMFRPHPRIHPHLYRRRDPLYLPQVRTPRYDLAFVDGPRWARDRKPELVYARDRCAAVAVHDFWEPELRRLLGEVFDEGRWRAEQFLTDPGEALALLTRA